MTQPTRGNYDVNNVEGIDKLRSRMDEAETIRDWSFILSDYISWGNNKIAKNVGIFNMNSATDCPNANSTKDNQSDTGVCQVPWEDCYAHKAENIYPQTLPYRRRQEYLWDCLDAETFAKAFMSLVSRKRNDVTALRLSEAGDFRHKGDIIKADRIAELLEDKDIDVYTYSASHKLDWSEAEHFTVNQSNALADYGDRQFMALPEGSELPEGTVWCPFDYADSKEDRPKCGECQLCINEDGPDVAIELH